MSDKPGLPRADVQLAATLLGRSADLAFVDGNTEHETNCRLLARRLTEYLQQRRTRLGEQRITAAHGELAKTLGRPPTRDELGQKLGVSSRGGYWRARYLGLALTAKG